MAGVFAIAMLSGVVGNVGVVETQAQYQHHSYWGRLNQGDFNQHCAKTSPITWQSYYRYSYSLSTYRCSIYNTRNAVTLSNRWALNWSYICANKYGWGDTHREYGRIYANWQDCYIVWY